jgi:hypothetical protein
MPRNRSLKTIFSQVETRTTIRHSYKLTADNKPVFITLIPGDTGQAALTNVILDQQVKVEEHPGALINFNLGTSDELNLKRLKVITVITDRDGDPDLTSFEIELTGGLSTFNKKVQLIVTEQGETVGYEANIKFFR